MPLAINMVNLNVDDMFLSRQRERYQKAGFTKKYPKIPDDSEKIRYGLSIAEKYWVGYRIPTRQGMAIGHAPNVSHTHTYIVQFKIIFDPLFDQFLTHFVDTCA